MLNTPRLARKAGRFIILAHLLMEFGAITFQRGAQGSFGDAARVLVALLVVWAVKMVVWRVQFHWFERTANV
jgi:hypothetical protein